MDSLSGGSSKHGVSAVVLLAGGLVLPPLARAAGRSVLDLTVAHNETVLERWLRLTSDLRGVPVRAVHGPQIPAPEIPSWARADVQVIRERDAYRGPAGAIRDATEDLPSGDWILVIEGTRYHHGSIDPVLHAVACDDSDVFVSCTPERAPAGVYAMRRSVLDHVASVGYVDLKEQLIARARAAGDRVRVVEHGEGMSFPLRTRTELLRAASYSSNGTGARATEPGAPRVLTGERWSSLVDDSARVDPSAVIVESIVMPGARVGRNAVVARSLVCPGGHVPADAIVLDETVSTGKNVHERTRVVGEDRRGSRPLTRVPLVRLGRRIDRQQGTAT